MLCLGAVFPGVIPEERHEGALPDAEEVILKGEKTLLFWFKLPDPFLELYDSS